MKRHPAWLAVALMLFAVLACNLSKKSANSTNTANSTDNSNSNIVSTSTGVLSDAHMAVDDGSGDPGEATNTFNAADRTIHCVVKLKDAQAGTKMKFSWFVIEATGSQNERIRDIDYTTRALENVVHAHLTAPRDWPVGKYKVEVYVNGNLEQTVPFTVE
ncbi:MAG TPA: hypothetical protein VJS64_05190 [Pyrinomonadaceae bacterium]|nr:hypothetical protein [Pyrinomonadaceae bacterium]